MENIRINCPTFDLCLFLDWDVMEYIYIYIYFFFWHLVSDLFLFLFDDATTNSRQQRLFLPTAWRMLIKSYWFVLECKQHAKWWRKFCLVCSLIGSVLRMRPHFPSELPDLLLGKEVGQCEGKRGCEPFHLTKIIQTRPPQYRCKSCREPRFFLRFWSYSLVKRDPIWGVLPGFMPSDRKEKELKSKQKKNKTTKDTLKKKITQKLAS